MRKEARLACGIIAIIIILSTTSIVPLPWKGQKFIYWIFEQVGRNLDRWPRLTACGSVGFAALIGTVIGSTCFLFAAQTGLTANPLFYLITTTVFALFLDLIRAWVWFWIKPKLTDRLKDSGYEAIRNQAWWVTSKLNQTDYRRMVAFDFDWFNAYRKCAAVAIACSATAVVMSQASTAGVDPAQWVLRLPSWTQAGPDWLFPTIVGALVMAMLTLTRETTIHAIWKGRHLYQRPPDLQHTAMNVIATRKRHRSNRIKR